MSPAGFGRHERFSRLAILLTRSEWRANRSRQIVSKRLILEATVGVTFTNGGADGPYFGLSTSRALSAASALLDRGWGRAPQVGEDGGDIRITIRQIVEGGDED